MLQITTLIWKHLRTIKASARLFFNRTFYMPRQCVQDYNITIMCTFCTVVMLRYTIQKNEQWGAEVEPGVWNGLIGEIQRQV